MTGEEGTTLILVTGASGNVGNATLRALLDRGHRLSGPQAVTPAAQVEILGRVLGRKLRFDAWPDDKARVELAKELPEPYVEAVFSFFVDGTIDETTVLSTVEQLLGRPPSTFEAWARANATRFARR
jgi:uncharacterized protein YbjT (DUF2867 family)